MGATPNFHENTTPSGGTMSGASTGNYSDDVSFNRGGQDTANQGGVDTAKRMLDTGMHKTQDAVSQIQAKASELTSKLIDNINVDELTQKLEAQVREHPMRSLLIAVGAGYVLGASLKK